VIKHFLAIALASLMGTSANAQDIRWQSEKMTPGAYVSINQSQGEMIHHVYTGRRGKAFVLTSYRGAKPGGTPAFETHLDKDGNYVRWVRPDGFEIRYRPHDCTRTLGQCSYKEIHSDGTRKQRTRVTEATKKGLAFKEYDENGTFLFGGKMNLEEGGWAGNGVIDSAQGKQRFTLKKRGVLAN